LNPVLCKKVITREHIRPRDFVGRVCNYIEVFKNMIELCNYTSVHTNVEEHSDILSTKQCQKKLLTRLRITIIQLRSKKQDPCFILISL